MLRIFLIIALLAAAGLPGAAAAQETTTATNSTTTAPTDDAEAAARTVAENAAEAAQSAIENASQQPAATPTATPAPETTVPTNTATQTPVDTATPEPSNDGNQTEYVTAVDSVTRVVSWDYQDGSFSIVFEVDVPQLVTVSESPDVEEGAGTFNVRQVSLPRGQTRVEIGATSDAGAAVVTITTSQCIRAGSCPYISTGERDSGSPFKRTSSSAGWLGGTLVTAAMVATAAYRRKNKEQKGPEDLE